MEAVTAEAVTISEAADTNSSFQVIDLKILGAPLGRPVFFYPVFSDLPVQRRFRRRAVFPCEHYEKQLQEMSERVYRENENDVPRVRRYEIHKRHQ